MPVLQLRRDESALRSSFPEERAAPFLKWAGGMAQLRGQFAVWNLELWRDKMQVDGVSLSQVEGYDQAIRKVQHEHEATWRLDGD